MLKNQLPVLYNELLPERFLELSIEERLATCSDCRMCGKNFVASAKHRTPYEPSTKCCTFYPYVANYLVGGVLATNSEPDHPVRQLLRDRQWALPIGIVAPPSYQKKFREKAPEEFGRNVDFTCPFYRSLRGECGIWQWRDSECTTYFCASSFAERGDAFWQSAGEFLFEVEMLLSQDCMVEKGYDYSEVEDALRYIKSNGGEGSYFLTAPEWSRFWQHHADRVELYFVECYQLVLERKSDYRREIDLLYRRFGDRLNWNKISKPASTI